MRFKRFPDGPFPRFLGLRNGPLNRTELVVKAVPTSPNYLTEEDVEQLHLRLFNLLSFLVSREVGIGPIAGLDDKGEIVWAHFSSSRRRPGRPGFRWCAEQDMGPVLSTVASGYCEATQDRAIEEIVGRSIEALCFSNSGEVLDVRIPIACTALETFAWAYLRRCEDVGREEAKHMPLGVMLRRLLTAAQIPTQIPDNLKAFHARAKEIEDLKEGDAPKILASIRNGLVHPPKNLEDPEWPSHDQLIEAWQISTWYLELMLLLWLRYDDHFLSRIDLWNGAVHPTPVPWASSSSQDNQH